MRARVIVPGNPGHHAVQIYQCDDAFRGVIADFIADGLAASQPTLVLATAPHCEQIVQELTARRFDVPALMKACTFQILDAHETLNVIVSEGKVDAGRFNEVAGLALQRLKGTTKNATVRVYGELVDVLWRRGDVDSALRLEALWNELLTRHAVSLLCGYWMETFVAHPAHRDVFTYHTSVQH